MLFTANQPIPAIKAFSPDGRMLPRKPKPVRLSTIWQRPSLGPQVDRTACEIEPAAEPMTIASTVCQNVSPKYRTPSSPTAMVANSMFGETHVQNSWLGTPCRSPGGIGSTPPGSTATTFWP